MEKPWIYDDRLQQARGYFSNLKKSQTADSLLMPTYDGAETAIQTGLGNDIPDWGGSFDVYTGDELVDNPSPAFFNTMANLQQGLFTGAVNAFGGPFAGYFFNEAFNYGKNPNTYSWSPRSLLDLALGVFVPNIGSQYGGKFGFDVGGKYGGLLGGWLGGKLQGDAQKSLLGQVLNSIANLDQGNPYKGERGWLEKGIDSLTGKYSPDEPTIGNPITDPFLAVGPDTEVYDGINMLGDPNMDPYGATPPDFGSSDVGGGTGWGGPDGSWSGDAWGDSWY